VTRRRRGRPAETGPAAETSVDAGQPRSIFLRGLSLGALVGAVIAGSAIWERRRLRRGRSVAAEAPADEPGTA
jgi:hypothetical protein